MNPPMENFEGLRSKNCKENSLYSSWNVKEFSFLLVETRWSARHDAVFATKSHYENVVDALEKLSEQSENADTRCEASTTLASISTFPFLCFLNI